jgi:hypothetical protein
MPGGYGGGEGGFGGGMVGGSGKAGMTIGSVTQDAQVDPNLITVELYGIVCIYNPVNKAQFTFDAPAGGAAPPADGSVPPAAVEPAPGGAETAPVVDGAPTETATGGAQ